ncbi:spore cortex-lytic enzyme [Anaeromicrobium sediminis]|uniref:Spore cortex-lytic enzyme n=1 Tax=Anaeromicrobium sediminis TaxID=1478221 RepID=A0A267M9R5_9FIRM|nr:spore cortex-lytic enzyme [Anaeromicrobium sediminis]PAB56314.1 spore cortex-lytic enzyme [Anaeromicrobium sediminis]
MNKKYSRILLLILVMAIIIGILNMTMAETLYWGARGETVKVLQDKLKRWGYMDGNVDGIYGPQTYRAVVKFQKKHGLVADGVVGSKTAQKLGLTLKKSTTTAKAKAKTTSTQKNSKSMGYRDNEVQLLAKAINGEARGEPYTGQVAVGAVILNRVKHASFPNTIAGVIYQPGAFEAVANGQVNAKLVESSVKAARDALNGWDPTGGCRYYWNPATATSKWIWSRKVEKKIGKHWFGN